MNCTVALAPAAVDFVCALYCLAWPRSAEVWIFIRVSYVYVYVVWCVVAVLCLARSDAIVTCSLRLQRPRFTSCTSCSISLQPYTPLVLHFHASVNKRHPPEMITRSCIREKLWSCSLDHRFESVTCRRFGVAEKKLRVCEGTNMSAVSSHHLIAPSTLTDNHPQTLTDTPTTTPNITRPYSR